MQITVEKVDSLEEISVEQRFVEKPHIDFIVVNVGNTNDFMVCIRDSFLQLFSPIVNQNQMRVAGERLYASWGTSRIRINEEYSSDGVLEKVEPSQYSVLYRSKVYTGPLNILLDEVAVAKEYAKRLKVTFYCI